MNTDLPRLFDYDPIKIKDEKIKQLKEQLEISNKRVAELEIILLEIEQKIQNASQVSDM